MKAYQRIPASFSVLIVLILCLPLPLTGCQLFSETTRTDSKPAYPDSIAKGEVYDVQVFRQSTRLKLTNITTRDFGPSTIWLNQRYSLQIDGLRSGQTIDLNLKEFSDEFGDTFRAGGFFAQRVPAPVVLCQLEVVEPIWEDQSNVRVMHGFVVVENAMD
ncbi:MAG: hypothetical protein JJ974_02860 [Phycisphaerales bacterium]|nr:hypothetical protein [Phycisphaerales bacterium]